MALHFPGTSTYIKLTGLGSPVNTLPLTLACWFRMSITEIGLTTLISVGKDGDGLGYALWMEPLTPYHVDALIFSVFGVDAQGPAASTDTWHYGIAEFVDAGGGNTTMSIWLDNVAGTPSTHSDAARGTPNYVMFSGRMTNGLPANPIQPITGCACEFAVWNDTLSSGDRSALQAGGRASDVHPTNLLYYMPADVDTTLRTGTATVTVSGGTLGICASAPPLTPFVPPVTPPEVIYQVPIVIGCPYTSQAQLLRPDFGNDAGAQAGPAFAKKRRLHWYGAYLFRTRVISFGTGFDAGQQLTAKLKNVDGGPEIGNTELFTGIISTQVKDDYGWTSQLAWQQTRPTPGTILAVSGYIETSEK